MSTQRSVSHIRGMCHESSQQTKVDTNLQPLRRENTVLRSGLPPESVYVIPNALVADQFKPDLTPKNTSEGRVLPRTYLRSMPAHPSSLTVVTIVVISRLAYRKGIDLLVATAPRICKLFPNARFVVGAFFQNSCKHAHLDYCRR